MVIKNTVFYTKFPNKKKNVININKQLLNSNLSGLILISFTYHCHNFQSSCPLQIPSLQAMDKCFLLATKN